MVATRASLPARDYTSTLPVENCESVPVRYASFALLPPEAFPLCVYGYTCVCIRTTRRQARTVEGYRTIVRGVNADPTLGKTPLDRVTVKTIDDYKNRLGHRGLAPGSILRYHSLLRSA